MATDLEELYRQHLESLTPEERRQLMEMLARDSVSRAEKLAAMREAAEDALFLADLNEVTEDFAAADAETHSA